jgi:hypothetical protein
MRGIEKQHSNWLIGAKSTYLNLMGLGLTNQTEKTRGRALRVLVP